MDRRSGGTASSSATGIRWRLGAASLVGLLTILAAIGIARLRIDDDLRSLLRDSEADFRLVDEVSDRFGTPDLECIVRVVARAGDLFAPAELSALRELSEKLGSIAGVGRVRSMFDVRRQGVAGAILPVIPRVDGELSPTDLDAARTRAIAHPLVVGHLLSPDARSAILLVRLDVTADKPPRLGQVVSSIEDLLADEQANSSPLVLELTGIPALREQAARALRRDMLLFNGIGFSLAVALSAWVARSVRSTIVACVPPFVGAIWAMGLIGLCGVPVNILTSVVPSLAMVVGTCDSIHFIEDMRRSARRGVDAIVASTGAIQRVGTACGLTSIVTAIGFSSLAAARIDAVRVFGMAAAGGAIASFIAVTFLTPLLASSPALSGASLGRSSRLAGRFAGTLTAFSLRHSQPLAVAALVTTLLLALFGAQLDADNRVIDALPRNASAARALARVDDDFGGVMGVDVVVRWPEGLHWLDDRVLDAITEVHGVLERSGGLTHAISLATVAQPLPWRARHRLDPMDFVDMVDTDSRTAIVRARVGDLGSRTLDRLFCRVDEGLTEVVKARPGWTCELAGMSVVSARNIRQLIRDLGGSLVLEVVVISVILAISFRSPLAGFVSIIPNIFPLTVIAAFLVLSGRALDPATVIVFNVCLGLAVDDTVHLLAAIQRHRREGVPIASSVRRAVAESGNAVVLGGFVLAVGFAAVTASSIPSLAGFGVLACIAVASATLAELVLLPALLVVADSCVPRRSAARGNGIFGVGPMDLVTIARRESAGKLAG